MKSIGVQNSITRRNLVLAAGVGLLTTNVGKRAFASDSLKVGFISPRTGPLASFGETDAYVIDHVRKAIAGGFEINGKTFAVEIIDRDSQSDPSRAAQLAKELINNRGVDLMLVISAPETVNPVSDACEAAGIPCLSTVMPWEAWYFGRGAKPDQPSPFRWTYHFGFGVDEFHKAYVSQWSLIPTNKRVGVMYPNDADGNAVRANLAPLLTKDGFVIIDPGAYESGTTDFSSQIALFRREGVEIINTFPIPPDFVTFWRQAAQQGLHRQVKIVQVAKTGLFPSSVEALGKLGPKLAGGAYWHKAFPYKSTITGVTGNELADGYELQSGNQWTQQLGATLALFDAGLTALRNAADPKQRQSVANALASLKTLTIAGEVDFTNGPFPNVAKGAVVGTQWVSTEDGLKFPLELVITENSTDPNVPVSAKLLAYNGG